MSALLDELLVDPETHEKAERATDAQLESIRRAIADGRAKKPSGGELPEAVDGATLTHGGLWVYPDAHGFPSLLVEERVVLDEPV
jgi:hypothetical protein